MRIQEAHMKSHALTAKVFLFLVICSVALLSSCMFFINAAANQPALHILLPGSNSRAAASHAVDYYLITLSNGTETLGPVTYESGSAASFDELSAGIWNITVEAYYEGSLCGSGTATATVTPGTTAECAISLSSVVSFWDKVYYYNQIVGVANIPQGTTILDGGEDFKMTPSEGYSMIWDYVGNPGCYATLQPPETADGIEFTLTFVNDGEEEILTVPVYSVTSVGVMVAVGGSGAVCLLNQPVSTNGEPAATVDGQNYYRLTVSDPTIPDNPVPLTRAQIEEKLGIKSTTTTTEPVYTPLTTVSYTSEQVFDVQYQINSNSTSDPNSYELTFSSLDAPILNGSQIEWPENGYIKFFLTPKTDGTTQIVEILYDGLNNKIATDIGGKIIAIGEDNSFMYISSANNGTVVLHSKDTTSPIVLTKYDENGLDHALLLELLPK